MQPGAGPRPFGECLAAVQRPRNGRVSYSSTYGPVTQLARFAPPPEDEARAMIEERFGCFFDTLEEEP